MSQIRRCLNSREGLPHPIERSIGIPIDGTKPNNYNFGNDENENDNRNDNGNVNKHIGDRMLRDASAAPSGDEGDETDTEYDNSRIDNNNDNDKNENSRARHVSHHGAGSNR